MTAVSTATVAWRGTGDETERLLTAVAHNCDCEFGPVGVRFSTCAAHQMLVEDQRALNGLLFGKYLADRLRREEWATQTAPWQTTSND